MPSTSSDSEEWAEEETDNQNQLATLNQIFVDSGSSTLQGQTKFVEFGKRKFSAFLEQATSYLDYYWPNWRNYGTPASYLIPDRYSYSHGNLESFEAVEHEREERKSYSRMAAVDITKRKVYAAIQELILLGIEAPFIALAIDNSNIAHTESQLKEIFPDLDEVDLLIIHDYDFIIVGRTFGIVVIKVKNANYYNDESDSNELNNGYGFVEIWPADILLFRFLQKCSRLGKKQSHVFGRELILTINFDTKTILYDLDEKETKRDFLRNLRMRNVTISRGVTICEPIEIVALTRQAIASMLHGVFINGATSVVTSNEVFEAYAAVLTAISSVTVLKERKCDIKTNFTGADPEPRYLSKICYLTRRQLDVLQAPHRLFIVGAAGTGKTIVLQTKALQLLSQGASINVLVPKSVIASYTDLFNSYGYKCYKVLGWPNDAALMKLNKFCETLEKNVKNCFDGFVYSNIDYINEKVLNDFSLNELGEILPWGHILIDDAFDEQDGVDIRESRRSLLTCLTIMMIASLLNPEKVVWIALDSLIGCDSLLVSCDKTPLDFLNHFSGWGHYYISILRQVVRCTKSIYRAAYADLDWLPDLDPLTSHKLEGFKPIVITDNCGRTAEAVEAVWTQINFILQHFTMVEMALIIADSNPRLKLREFLTARWQQYRAVAEINKLPIPKLAIHTWREVSSLEWPVVIYVACIPQFMYSIRQKYRAASRATTRLVEINVVCSFTSEDGDSDEKQVATVERNQSWSLIRPEEVSDWRYLADGSFGKVFAAVFENRGVAVKVIPWSDRNENKWRHEVEMLEQVSHPNIVSILGVVNNRPERELWIVTELLDGGSLRPYCTGDDDDVIMQLNEPSKIAIGVQCWSALCYMHNAVSMTHKDLKPENILLRYVSGGLEAKICDFGMAKLRDAVGFTRATTVEGTWMYLPPELSKSTLNPEKGDVYSLGATFIEFFTNFWFWHYASDGTPFEPDRTYDLLTDIYKTTAAGLPVKLSELTTFDIRNAVSMPDGRDYHPSIADILKRAVSYDRALRPSAAEVLAIFENLHAM